MRLSLALLALVTFVGCQPTAETLRGTPAELSALQVDVELTGKDGQKVILILTSDGTPAGEG